MHILCMCRSRSDLITPITDRHCFVLNHVLTRPCAGCTSPPCCHALQLEVELAERRARAEEEGLDEEEDTEYDLRMVRSAE